LLAGGGGQRRRGQKDGQRREILHEIFPAFSKVG
jgi:hypothetical protein